MATRLPHGIFPLDESSTLFHIRTTLGLRLSARLSLLAQHRLPEPGSQGSGLDGFWEGVVSR